MKIGFLISQKNSEGRPYYLMPSQRYNMNLSKEGSIFRTRDHHSEEKVTLGPHLRISSPVNALRLEYTIDVVLKRPTVIQYCASVVGDP